MVWVIRIVEYATWALIALVTIRFALNITFGDFSKNPHVNEILATFSKYLKRKLLPDSESNKSVSVTEVEEKSLKDTKSDQYAHDWVGELMWKIGLLFVGVGVLVLLHPIIQPGIEDFRPPNSEASAKLMVAVGFVLLIIGLVFRYLKR